MQLIDTSILDKLIFGRVEPHIYAFTTQTVPNYLKVGDTYRPVDIRLNEWRRHYPNLVKEYNEVAKVDDDTFFRDYAVHQFLQDSGFQRLMPDEISGLSYYSSEFFRGAAAHNVEEAINDIKDKYAQNSSRYNYYKFENSRIPLTHHYPRTETFDLRPNQDEAVKKFIQAKENNRTNLLMYAVMRFGKSFTSMCCAEAMGAKLVVIVSAKADVKEEWKKTVESHVKFKDYIFASRDELNSNPQLISQTLQKGERIALFLTLQDLQGESIKERHTELFQNSIDLLIIDETHFAARAEEYGKVLKQAGLSTKERQIQMEDASTIDEIDIPVKSLNSKIRLHLSGTPYRILMGDEFSDDDIVSFCQFTDIVDAQEKWDKDYLQNDDVKEWDNPYYGFPQMIRFAFTPSKVAQARLNALKQNGCSYAFSELLKPKSIVYAKDKSHRQFKYELEVLDLFSSIDGSKEDETILPFLDYSKIKDGKMCRHIVCVLPFCASCDALEDLLKKNKESFKILGSYEIVNISGLENQYKDTESIKAKIELCEKSDIKTITLTVNRMLTGSTVEQWDTMLYLKDTSSPQEYDQAIFRLQNQYVRSFKDENGDIIKFNMKPQTLLVDFAPNRMFEMQELKSQIYNANTDKNGNSKLAERIERELQVSPIVVLNKNRLQEVTPANILDTVREYSREKSVMDEANDIPVDSSLLADPRINSYVSELSPIDSSKGISIKPHEGKETDFEFGDDDDPPVSGSVSGSSDNTNPSGGTDNNNEDLNKQLSTCYAIILFFAFLTKDEVRSLEDILKVIPKTDDNREIYNDLGLNFDILKLIQKRSNPFILSKLDYKIQNINSLMRDISLSPLERVQAALKKFGRLSDSEIVTPANIADSVVSLLPADDLNGRILDIASKQGEFSIALYKRFGESIKDKLYAVPTSAVTYQFTKKIFELLDIPTSNIFRGFTSYDLIKENNKQYIQTLLDMHFKAIVGNPPYQDKGGSGGNNDAPIYQCFAKVATDLKPDYISMIIKAAWLAAGRENLLGSFRKYMMTSGHIKKMVVYSDSSTLFSSDVEIKGGICYYLEEAKYSGDCNYTLFQGSKEISCKRKLDAFDVIIRDPRISSIVEKVNSIRITNKESTVDTIISSDTPFGIPSNPKASKKNPTPVFSSSSDEHDVQLYHIENGKRKIEFVSKQIIKKNAADISKPKVFITGAGGSGNDKKIMGIPVLAPANSVCSQSYLYAAFNTTEEANNFIKYIYTKFFRIMLASLKITQSAPSKTYRYIPMQDFTSSSDIDWSASIDAINEQLLRKYGIENSKSFIDEMITAL